MVVGTLRLSLLIRGSRSLKDKRRVLRSFKDRVRNRYNVSIAVVEYNDRHQLLTLGVSCVSNDSRHANEILSHVVDYVHSLRGDAELLDYELEIIAGV